MRGEKKRYIMIKPRDKNIPDWLDDVMTDEIYSDDQCADAAVQAETLDFEPIVAQTTRFFEPDSPLADAYRHGGRPYEYRQQQAEMAFRISEALARSHNLCVEAPTGIGKSFAYLIPAIYYTQIQPLPLVITTETINLQEQLIEKDIPILKLLTGIDFRAALAKGRGNYLCRRRLELCSGERQNELLPSATLVLDINRLEQWADTATFGDRDTIDFRMDEATWGFVCCEVGNCTGPMCRHYSECFYWRARREWEKANIIVANHAMFFTDLNMKQDKDLDKGLLPVYSSIIIDEAHTLENNAAEYLGIKVNSGAVTSFLNRLFNPDNGKGLLLRSGAAAMDLRAKVAELRRTATAFFSMVEHFMLEKEENIRRYRTPAVIPDLLSKPLGELRAALTEYSKLLEDRDYRVEIDSMIARCEAYINTISEFINMNRPDHVYWVEEAKGGVTMQAAPLRVNDLLAEILFRQGMPVILSSATLTVRQSFDYYRSRVGYCNGAELRLDSPFSPQQVKLYLAGSMPDPNDKDYLDALNNNIPEFIKITGGKAFVLFTSYKTLKACVEKLKSFFTDNKITLLIQGDGLTRSAMLKVFKEDINSVIFGTDSFWTGVDVPGEALSNVIITKIPFPVPTHPLVEARSEIIKAAGANDFMFYSLPEAVLKFRQGVGRLIRSKNDTGIIVILDSRIVAKRYGKLFLESIPPYPIKYS
jgi:ATP-dependent DNA helicase DinG